MPWKIKISLRVAIVFAFNSRKNDLSSALADYSLGFSLVSSNTTPLIKRASGNKISSQSVYPALHILWKNSALLDSLTVPSIMNKIV
jgi:hypothetical protein